MKNFKKNTRQIFKIVYNSLVICKKKKIGGLINMSKKDFVDAYAKATGETKKRSEELVNQFLETVEKTLLNGDSVQFVGWGTFEVKERAARTGINPQTKKEIKIPAKKVVKFKVGKKLADSVAEGK